MISIPYSRFYFIDKNGNVVKNKKVEEYEKINIPDPVYENEYVYIMTNSSYISKYKIVDLIIHSFYGIGDFEFIIEKGKRDLLDRIKFKINPIFINDEKILINNIVFKKIANFSGYYISKSSIIYSIKSNKFIRHKLDRVYGYHQASLICDNGRNTFIRIHRYVFFTWNDNTEYSRKLFINHKDGNKGNNDLSNLEESSPIHNTRHAIYNGLKKGVWTLDEAEKVAFLLEKGTDLKTIYNSLKTDKSYKSFVNLCYGMRKGRYFKDIVSKYKIGESSKRQKYSEDIIRSLCEDFETDNIYLYNRKRDYFESLSEKNNIPYFIVYQVYKKIKWKKISKDYNF